jgi:hypothetical protein
MMMKSPGVIVPMTGATSVVEIELVKADKDLAPFLQLLARTATTGWTDAHSTCRASEMELTDCGMRNCPKNVTPITILPVDYVKWFCGWRTPLVAGLENGT